MKIKNLFLASLLMIFGLSTISSCDDDEKTMDPASVELSADVQTLDASAGNTTFTITSNRDWTLEINPVSGTSAIDWLTVNPKSGSASSQAVTITATALENTGAKRSAKLTISTETITKEVVITQAAGDGSDVTGDVLTVKQLVSSLSSLESGASLSSLGNYLEAYVAATEESSDKGNFFAKVSLVDNTGEAGTGILLYHKDGIGVTTGDKVKIKLDNMIYSPYHGLEELTISDPTDQVTIESSGNDIVTPEITASQIIDYQGMVVIVKDVQAASSIAADTPWVDSANNKHHLFTDGTTEFQVNISKYSTFTGNIDITKTANLRGFAGAYNTTGSIDPLNQADIDVLTVGADDGGDDGDVSTKVGNVADLWAVIDTLQEGSKISASLGFVEAIVTTNNAGGNLFQKIAIVDGTGAAGTGILIKDASLGDTDYLPGDKIKVSLANSTYSYGVISGVTSSDIENLSSGETYTIPTITVDQITDYLSMYVKIDNVSTSVETLSSDSEFTDGTNTFVIYYSNYLADKDFIVSQSVKTTAGTISGVTAIYGDKKEILIQSKDDVADFLGETKEERDYSSNLTLATEDSSDDAYYAHKITSISGGTEYSCLKLGKSSSDGTWTSGVIPSGTKITFYACGWKAKNTTLTVTVNNGGTIDGAASKVIALTSNDGATGNSPYIVDFTDEQAYTFDLADVTDATTLTFATSKSGHRALVTAVNIK